MHAKLHVQLVEFHLYEPVNVVVVGNGYFVKICSFTPAIVLQSSLASPSIRNAVTPGKHCVSTRDEVIHSMLYSISA